MSKLWSTKPCGQIIEQGFVARRIGEAQIVWRLDDADVEVIGPDAIDERLGEVGIVRLAQPVHQRLAGVFDVRQIDFFAAENSGDRTGRPLAIFLADRACVRPAELCATTTSGNGTILPSLQSFMNFARN